MSDTDLNPHREGDAYSELNALIDSALRRYGDFAPGEASASLRLMFIEFANMVIDDIRMHPYWDGVEIPYYAHGSESRPIDDHVMVAAMLYRYSEQQVSGKLQLYAPAYFRALNQSLWRKINGNTKLRVRPTDGGSNKAFSRKTSTTNGLPLPETDA